jgi:hypothetical protein
MKSVRFALGSMLFLALFAGASQAQVQRTFVSGLGTDGNPCSRTSPCRTFSQAIMGTSAGGEVIVLDSAGYGAFSINKSVSVIAPQGVYAGISVFSGRDGIDINAGPSDVVILRGLTINSQGGENGIVFSSGGTLHIEGCVVNGFASRAGISILSPGNIVVKDTIARGNGEGIVVNPQTPGTVLVAMDALRLDSNGDGLTVAARVPGTAVNAAIRNSCISGNNDKGVAADSVSGAFAFLDVESCMVTNNGEGLVADALFGGSAALSISNCTISHNRFSGFDVTDGAIFSRGNNTLLGNAANIGSLTPLAGQ